MSTSEDSSEDEEERNRISAAVLGIGTDLFQGNQKNSSEDVKLTKKSEDIKTRNGIDVSKLKSNRPQDKNEDNADNLLLQTTPEFRAYVAKQLTNLLDRELSESIVENLWQTTVKNRQEKEKGLKLFSDSTCLCKINNKVPIKDLPKLKEKRVVRLSSSSDSSEDETIKACVFTVVDIQRENERLAEIREPIHDKPEAKQTHTKMNKKHLSSDKSCPASIVGKDNVPNELNEELSSYKKKKKKKKKNKKDKVVELTNIEMMTS